MGASPKVILAGGFTPMPQTPNPTPVINLSAIAEILLYSLIAHLGLGPGARGWNPLLGCM
jgi:hypothetical protein